MLDLPVESPSRAPSPHRPRPRRGCPDCRDNQACQRHGYDVLRSAGVFRSQRSADDYVRDWRPFP